MNMENFPTFLLVVAGVLFRDDRRFLMQRRPAHKYHGGLWEFPGGKVEAGETPVNSLIRELFEELDIRVTEEAVHPFAFAQDGAAKPGTPLVILLYTVRVWGGEPRSTEGAELRWLTLDDARALPMPPLDCQLLRHLENHTMDGFDFKDR